MQNQWFTRCERKQRADGDRGVKSSSATVNQVSPLKPSRALHLHRDEVRRLVEERRARNPRIFGSVLHGRDNEDSDLDLLVDPLPGATLFDLGGLQVALEDLLGIRVDLLTPGDLPQRSREKVLLEARPV
jgi:predicted nucleotidyltransferase